MANESLRIIEDNPLLPKDESHRMLDSTKLSCYKACPRKFFWQYIVGWKPEGESIHLVFGTAWHLAMEHMLLKYKEEGTYSLDAVIEAHAKFEGEYRPVYGMEYEDFNAPKNSENALRALTAYAAHYKDRDKFEVLHTEVAGTVPISDSRVMHMKIDGVCRDDDGFFVSDHKTTSRLSSSWQEQWIMSSQMSTYVHALLCIYPPQEVYGAIINGVVLRKSENDFIRIPIRKTQQFMENWLVQTNHWFDRIEEDYEVLSQSSPDDSVLAAFPQNDGACTDWGMTCPFLPYCTAYKNPLKMACGDVQPGFEKRFWNPMIEHAKTAKRIIHLEEEEGGL